MRSAGWRIVFSFARFLLGELCGVALLFLFQIKGGLKWLNKKKKMIQTSNQISKYLLSIIISMLILSITVVKSAIFNDG